MINQILGGFKTERGREGERERERERERETKGRERQPMTGKNSGSKTVSCKLCGSIMRRDSLNRHLAYNCRKILVSSTQVRAQPSCHLSYLLLMSLSLFMWNLESGIVVGRNFILANAHHTSPTSAQNPRSSSPMFGVASSSSASSNSATRFVPFMRFLSLWECLVV